MAEDVKVKEEKEQVVSEALAAMEKRLKEMEAELKSGRKITKDEGGSQVEREDRPGPGGGWLVKTPVEGYSEVTAGVKFNNGYAIVDVGRDGSDSIVHRLEHDFHYTVAAMEADEVNELRRLMAQAEGRPGGPVKTLGEKLAMVQR